MAQKKEGLNGMSENEKLDQAMELNEEVTEAPGKPAKSKKDKDAKPKEKKPGIFARIAKWFREMKSELKKVVWPTKSQMINNTLIVLACVLVVGIFIWVFDAVGGVVVNGIITLVKG